MNGRVCFDYAEMPSAQSNSLICRTANEGGDECMAGSLSVRTAGGKTRWNAVRKYKLYYLLMLPGLIYYLIFKYVPDVGIIVAFKNIMPFEGLSQILTDPWVGLQNFKTFFHSYYFWQILRNTLLISFYKILFGFPAPIILALLLNEIRNAAYKRVVQTVSYLPHFISIVVMAGLLTNILSTQGGIVNAIIKLLGGNAIFFLGDSHYFRGVLVSSDVWKNIGWGAIIYLAAITGIDPGLYEAATMDGAGKLKQMWCITLPGISDIISIMLILRMGGILNAGFEQILTLYSPSVYDVADIIDTYVYRMGLQNMQYSFATAVGLFKSAFSLIFVLGTNLIAKRMGQEGIW